MSLDPSLKSASSLVRHRNVLTRDERLARLKDEEKWTAGRSVFGLPKVANRKANVGKAEKEETAEGRKARHRPPPARRLPPRARLPRPRAQPPPPRAPLPPRPPPPPEPRVAPAPLPRQPRRSKRWREGGTERGRDREKAGKRDGEKLGSPPTSVSLSLGPSFSLSLNHSASAPHPCAPPPTTSPTVRTASTLPASARSSILPRR